MGYSTYDSYTTADGTQYVARYTNGKNIIEKYDSSGKRSVISSQKGTSKSGNKNAVAKTFDSFKEGLQKADAGEELTYKEEDVNAIGGTGGFLGLGGDKSSTLTMSDGTVISSRAGKTSNEVKTVKRLADEIVRTSITAIETKEEVVVDDEVVDEEIVDDEEEVVDDEEEVVEEPIVVEPDPPIFPLQPVDSSVAGGGFESVIPETEVQQVPAGGVATIDPNRPQTVVQQVSPVTYQDVPVTSTLSGATPQQMTTSITSPTTGYVSGFAPPQVATTGTFSQPTQTGGLSAVPQQVTYKTHYAGTQGAVPQTLVTTQPGTGAAYPEVYQGYQTVPYGNDLGQRIMITEFNGVPTTYVPPGFKRLSEITQQAQSTESAVGAAEGGLMESMSLEGKDRIFRKMGYNGPKTREGHAQYEASNPAAEAKGVAIGGYIQKFNQGGAVRGFETGGLTTGDLATMQASAVRQTMQPMQPTTAMIQPTAGEFIPVDAGMTVPIAPMAEAATVGKVQQAGMPVIAPVTKAYADPTKADVTAEAAKLQAATGAISDEAQVTAAQQETTSVSGLEAAQGTAIKVDAPDAREIQEGEIISGAADATKAAAFTEQIQAAEATPTKQATVKGQLETLMADFEGGETPAWAAGSMRTAMATLSARGLGASSLAGQAVIQAAMEAALPIAQMDAATVAQFEAQNLSNRQQRQMLAAQQRATFMGMEFDQAFQARVANSARIGDIANMNFTAEQQIALEDSRAANTMELSNLSNRQAKVMAEAAALSQLDMANLSNRQQSAVQNASNFLQMDMANLSNEQQTSMFKTQQNIQALFTDQAATNAASQFNASSENQTNQFFANLGSQVSQFNSTQQNAMDQFNVNSVNALREFNSGLQQQRDIFNAQNGLVIAQSNAAWRQSIATINTATQNESNMDFAKIINGLTASNMDQIWQRERDLMSFAFQLENNNADRATTIAVQELANEAAASSAAASRSGSFANAIGSVVGAIITGPK